MSTSEYPTVLDLVGGTPLVRLQRVGSELGPTLLAKLEYMNPGGSVKDAEVIAAADLLKTDWGVDADLWGCPSFTELARDGNAVARRNMLHPGEKSIVSHVEQCLAATEGPVIAATDYIRAYAEQIRAFVPRRYTALGTDGFGRSDTREKLRHFFEVDRHWVVLAALKALADEGKMPASKAAEAMKKYGLAADKPAPWTV